MTALKLTAIGTSTGAVIPKEMLARLKVQKGDILYAIETPEGYLLTPYDPDIDEQLKATTCKTPAETVVAVSRAGAQTSVLESKLPSLMISAASAEPKSRNQGMLKISHFSNPLYNAKSRAARTFISPTSESDPL